MEFRVGDLVVKRPNARLFTSTFRDFIPLQPGFYTVKSIRPCAILENHEWVILSERPDAEFPLEHFRRLTPAELISIRLHNEK